MVAWPRWSAEMAGGGRGGGVVGSGKGLEVVEGVVGVEEVLSLPSRGGDDKVKAFWRGSQTVRAHPQTLLKIVHHVLSVF